MPNLIKAACLCLVFSVLSVSATAAPVLYFSDANQAGVHYQAGSLAIHAKIDGVADLDANLSDQFSDADLNINLRTLAISNTGPFVNASFIQGTQSYDLSITSTTGELLLGANLNGTAEIQALALGSADTASFAGLFELSSGSLLNHFGGSTDLFATQFNLSEMVTSALFLTDFSANIVGDIGLSQVVPESGNLVLMLSALFALAALRRKQEMEL